MATDCAGLADHNATTGETVWEHPCDAYYRDLYAQLKSQKQQRAEETGAALPANLAALGLPANRYLDPLKKKAEAQQRKLKKGEDRQKLREERTQRNALKRAQREKRAAKKLQRMWRARQFRRSVNAFIQEKKAAVMVQARIRGILFRRRTREALIAQIENIAITKLQAAVRGNLSRNQLERRRAIKRKREEAAKAAREDLGAAKLVAKLVSTVSSSLKQRSRLPGMLTIFVRVPGPRCVPRTGWTEANRKFEQGWKSGDRQLYAAVRGEQTPGRMAGQARQAACRGTSCRLAD